MTQLTRDTIGFLAELRANNGRGGSRRAIPADQLMHWNLTLLNKDVSARFKIRRVFKDGELVRESHTLLGLDIPELQQIEQQV